MNGFMILGQHNIFNLWKHIITYQYRSLQLPGSKYTMITMILPSNTNCHIAEIRRNSFWVYYVYVAHLSKITIVYPRVIFSKILNFTQTDVHHYNFHFFILNLVYPSLVWPKTYYSPSQYHYETWI